MFLRKTGRGRASSFYARKPPAPPKPIRAWGGPITHEYILAQIVHSIGRPFGTHVEPAVDREVLWKEYRTTAPGEYRDVLALTLAWAGDARVGEKVAAYLENVKHDQSLRTKAAVGLGFLQDKQYVPLLVSVMRNDPQYLSRRTRDGAEKPVEERRY